MLHVISKLAIRLGNATLRVLGVVVSDVDTRTRLARLHIDLIEEFFRGALANAPRCLRRSESLDRPHG